MSLLDDVKRRVMESARSAENAAGDQLAISEDDAHLILAALEAAERLVGLEYVATGDLAPDSLLRADNINALVAALRGEVVPTD